MKAFSCIWKHKICNKGVFNRCVFLAYFSCKFNDQLSTHFHRFFIPYVMLECTKWGFWYLTINAKGSLPLTPVTHHQPRCGFLKRIRDRDWQVSDSRTLQLDRDDLNNNSNSLPCPHLEKRLESVLSLFLKTRLVKWILDEDGSWLYTSFL